MENVFIVRQPPRGRLRMGFITPSALALFYIALLADAIVRLLHGLKFFLGSRLNFLSQMRYFIGVIFDGHLAVRLFDLVVGHLLKSYQSFL